MKKSILLLTAILIVSTSACGNTTAPASSASKASTVPSSSVAEVKEPYVAIGGINPYEELTPTEKTAIKKAEEEARLLAVAKAKADAEAKANEQDEVKAKAQQNTAPQQTQPQQIEEGVYIAGYTKNGNPIYGGENAAEYVHRKAQEQIAAWEARGYYGKNKDDVPPEWKQQRQGSGVVAVE